MVGKVIVTGGAGFIGSELTRQLLADDYQVTVVDNLVNGRRDNLANVAGLLTIEVEDVRNSARMRELMHGQDIVYHLACLGVRHSIHSPRENHDVNATATLNLLHAARHAGVKRFVYVSSSEVYGTARTVPMVEEHPTFPMTVYGASKLAGECYTRAYCATYGYATTVVRPFNAYGPRSHHEGDSGEVIPKFLLRCLAGKPMVVFGDGMQTRDFTYVSDTARGILLAAMHPDAIGQTINIGQGREVSINALADEIRRIVGRPDAASVHDNPRPGDVLRLYSDSSRARNVLGFRPSVGLSDGLARLIAWYLSLPHTPAQLLEREVQRNWQVHESTIHGA
jgi:UDP-glucose 4-epimerase